MLLTVAPPIHPNRENKKKHLDTISKTIFRRVVSVRLTFHAKRRECSTVYCDNVRPESSEHQKVTIKQIQNEELTEASEW